MPLRCSAGNNSRYGRGAAAASAWPRMRFNHGKRQSGAFALIFVGILMAILAFCGLALDAGLIYNRKVELHGMAKAVALAAARELNGTPAGVTAALAKAKQTAERFRYQYNISFTWSDAAISFNTSPTSSAAWVDAATASGTPSKFFYVQVDTGRLDAAAGIVTTVFLPILSSTLSTFSLSDRAVAGRTAINVVPLAVCAMSTDPAAPRPNLNPPASMELVQYGFRRGVTYDLMELNPDDNKARNFVIDPMSPLGTPGNPSNTTASVVAPFVCTGTMWMPQVTGGSINVSSPFPLNALYNQLNSRFDQYSGTSPCSPNGAPPDYNVRQYAYDSTNTAPWMNPTTGSTSAARSTSGNRDQTIADLASPPSGTTAGDYGPLWSYARAVKYSSYTPGVPEPSAGYATFAPSDWANLYPSGPTASGYPTSSTANTPYKATSGANYKPPAATHLATSVEQRRVLNVPLLSCPVAGGSNVPATVLAVGKFFMTVPATNNSIYAEFAGIVPEQSLTGQVELYQ